MSQITYRNLDACEVLPQWADCLSINTYASTNKCAPLYNEEVDQNFASLNSHKLDITGKIPTKELRLFNHGQYKCWTNGCNATECDTYCASIGLTEHGGLVINASSVTFNTNSLSGNSFTTWANGVGYASKYIQIGYDDAYDQYDEPITILELADGAGILIGDSGIAGEGLINLKVNIDDNNMTCAEHSLRLYSCDNANDRIALRAADFVITQNENNAINSNVSLLDTHNTIADLNDELLEPTFPGVTYTIESGASLREALISLDAENIPAIKEFIGMDAYNNDTYYADSDPYSSVVTDGDSLATAITKLNTAMNYVIRNVEERNSSFIAHSGNMYIVDPYGEDDPYGLVVTLADANPGSIIIRKNNSGVLNVEAQSGNSRIENTSPGAGNYYGLEATLDTYQFIWQSTGTGTGIWRAIHLQ